MRGHTAVGKNELFAVCNSHGDTNLTLRKNAALGCFTQPRLLLNLGETDVSQYLVKCLVHCMQDAGTTLLAFTKQRLP